MMRSGWKIPQSGASEMAQWVKLTSPVTWVWSPGTTRWQETVNCHKIALWLPHVWHGMCSFAPPPHTQCRKGSNIPKHTSYDCSLQGCTCTLASFGLSCYTEGWILCFASVERRTPHCSSSPHLLLCVLWALESISYLFCSAKAKCASVSSRRIYSWLCKRWECRSRRRMSAAPRPTFLLDSVEVILI